MGCDIHTYAEKKTPAASTYLEIDGTSAPAESAYVPLDFSPFDCRSYGMFGFLADVRNYSKVPPLAEQRGVPADSPEHGYYHQDSDYHSASWLSVAELLAFDYDQTFEDRRYTRQEGPNLFNGAATCEPGQGQQVTFREFLPEQFFEDLEKLKELGADRVVFWFDN